MGKKRYTVKETEYGCELTLAEGYGSNLEDHPTIHEFWCGNAGYVRETTRNPGTAGRQVGKTLFGVGSTLYTTRQNLASEIRRLAKKHCDTVDKENHHWG